LTPQGRTALCIRLRTTAARGRGRRRRFAKKNTHRRPSRPAGAGRFGRPQDLMRTLG